MDIIITFSKLFLLAIWAFAPMLILLVAVIVLLGQVVGRIESWPPYDTLYWSFITATTVGYGDIRPSRRASKAISILIAFTGVVFTGITVALAVYAAGEALVKHGDSEAIELIKDSLQ